MFSCPSCRNCLNGIYYTTLSPLSTRLQNNFRRTFLVTDRNWNKYDSCGLLLIYMTKSLYRMHTNLPDGYIVHTLVSRMNTKSSPPALTFGFEMLKPRTSNLRMCQCDRIFDFFYIGTIHFSRFFTPTPLQSRYLSALGIWNIEFEKSTLMN